MTASDYCELCDLPRSQCIHGRPPPAPKPATPAAPRRRQAVSRKASPATPGAPASPAKPVTRRWTPPEVFAPLILDVLREAGGELEADEVFLELEILVEDRLLAGDRDTTPQGEPRWQAAARRARQGLMSDGTMTTARPGVWKLSEA
jgi:hypothetical protein